MISTIKCSYTLIGSLSKEGHSIGLRCKRIKESITNCKNKSLLTRLENELSELMRRRNELINITKTLYQDSSLDRLSLDFIHEICIRYLD